MAKASCNGECFNCIHPDCIISDKMALFLEEHKDCPADVVKYAFKKEHERIERYRKKNAETIKKKWESGYYAKGKYDNEK